MLPEVATDRPWLTCLLSENRFNRPKSLNAFGGVMMPEVIRALHEAEADPEVVVINLTGNGRFFSSGADVKGVAATKPLQGIDMRLNFLQGGSVALEMIRCLIDSNKVICVSLVS